MNLEQLKTIVWLRWRLMRNQWARRGSLGAVLAVLVSFGAVIMSGGCFMAALLGGMFGLADAKPSVIMAVWLAVTVAFLFFWTFGLVTELSRSESIDLQKLMHLPVALGQLFVVNYLVSHFTFSIVMMVPAMLGLAIGLAVARGPEMLLLIPLALSMVVMITAWTYCLRGWLASMMSNPRRRRTVIMCISLSFVLLAQGPNLYFNVFARHFGHKPASGENGNQGTRGVTVAAPFKNLVAIEGFVPPLWVPLGAQGLAEKRLLPALYGTLGCLGLAVLGVRRAYRTTMRAYLGERGGKAAARSRAADSGTKNPRPIPQSGRRFLEWRLTAVPEQSAALALATFRSMLRAPEVKMALASSVISMLILGVMLCLRAAPTMSDTTQPFIATGVVVFSVFMLVHFFANQFGFDRDGFRSLILSPAERRLILLGKNLAVMPIGLGFGLVLLTLVSIWLHLPPMVGFAALFQLMTLLLIASVGGNVLSILIPYRIQPGSLKPTKMPGLAMLVMILCQMLLPVAMAPVFIGPLLALLWNKAGLPDFVPVNLICSALLCGAMVVIYWQTLSPLGLLLQRREVKILGVVTVEVE